MLTSYKTRSTLDWIQAQSVFLEYLVRLGTTCSRDVAVSVRTPPKAPRWTGRAVLEEMREEAGRERREKERANTMLNDNEWNEVFR